VTANRPLFARRETGKVAGPCPASLPFFSPQREVSTANTLHMQGVEFRIHFKREFKGFFLVGFGLREGLPLLCTLQLG
jgi:hypothetical protein